MREGEGEGERERDIRNLPYSVLKFTKTFISQSHHQQLLLYMYTYLQHESCVLAGMSSVKKSVYICMQPVHHIRACEQESK